MIGIASWFVKYGIAKATVVSCVLVLSLLSVFSKHMLPEILFISEAAIPIHLIVLHGLPRLPYSCDEKQCVNFWAFVMLNITVLLTFEKQGGLLRVVQFPVPSHWLLSCATTFRRMSMSDSRMKILIVRSSGSQFKQTPTVTHRALIPWNASSICIEPARAVFESALTCDWACRDDAVYNTGGQQAACLYLSEEPILSL